ncbi:MAG TPA: hypothetical protein PLK46_13050, partial [Propioniciclava sp.]|uniref:hypothetical protein n=1 Tax=Propioniciclava sp. TaxID=2038686 RepID=UPI002B8BD46F
MSRVMVAVATSIETRFAPTLPTTRPAEHASTAARGVRSRAWLDASGASSRVASGRPAAPDVLAVAELARAVDVGWLAVDWLACAVDVGWLAAEGLASGVDEDSAAGALVASGPDPPEAELGD